MWIKNSTYIKTQILLREYQFKDSFYWEISTKPKAAAPVKST